MFLLTRYLLPISIAQVTVWPNISHFKASKSVHCLVIFISATLIGGFRVSSMVKYPVGRSELPDSPARVVDCCCWGWRGKKSLKQRIWLIDVRRNLCWQRRPKRGKVEKIEEKTKKEIGVTRWENRSEERRKGQTKGHQLEITKERPEKGSVAWQPLFLLQVLASISMQLDVQNNFVAHLNQVYFG